MSKLELPPTSINRMLLAVMGSERLILSQFSFPAGVSLLLHRVRDGRVLSLSLEICGFWLAVRGGHYFRLSPYLEIAVAGASFNQGTMLLATERLDLPVAIGLAIAFGAVPASCPLPIGAGAFVNRQSPLRVSSHGHS